MKRFSLLSIVLACLVANPAWSADEKGSGSASDKGSGSGSASVKGSGSASAADKGSASGSGSGSGSGSASAKGSGSGSTKGSGSGSAVPAERFVSSGQTYKCKVANWDKDSRTLLVDVEAKIPDLAVVRDILNLEAQLGQARLDTNPVSRLQKINDLSNQISQKQAVQFKSTWQKMEMKVQEDALVRMLVLPPRFDDKGFLVQPSKDEIKKLQDPKHPGLFKADLNDIRTGCYAQLTMVIKAGSGAKLPNLPQPLKPGTDPNAERPLIKLDGNFAVSYVLLGEDVPQGK
jgi:hypothetical protein